MHAFTFFHAGTLFKDGELFQKYGALPLCMFPFLETKFKQGSIFQGRRMTDLEADRQKAMGYKLHHSLASNSNLFLPQFPQSIKFCLLSCAFRLRHFSMNDICIFI